MMTSGDWYLYFCRFEDAQTVAHVAVGAVRRYPDEWQWIEGGVRVWFLEKRLDLIRDHLQTSRDLIADLCRDLERTCG